MTQTLTLTYLFDPLCGWCYGASETIAALEKHSSIDLKPMATGLFAGSGARPMKGFAKQAWANDQRIAALSGQTFSQDYRQNVLGSPDADLNSTVATLAVTAVDDTAPERVVSALKAIQSARYVDGRDVTSPAVVADVLMALGLAKAGARVLAPDESLLRRDRDRIAAARDLMATYRLQGVPALLVGAGGQRQPLDAGALYAGVDTVLAALDLV